MGTLNQQDGTTATQTLHTNDSLYTVTVYHGPTNDPEFVIEGITTLTGAQNIARNRLARGASRAVIAQNSGVDINVDDLEQSPTDLLALSSSVNGDAVNSDWEVTTHPPSSMVSPSSSPSDASNFDFTVDTTLGAVNTIGGAYIIEVSPDSSAPFIAPNTIYVWFNGDPTLDEGGTEPRDVLFTSESAFVAVPVPAAPVVSLVLSTTATFTLASVPAGYLVDFLVYDNSGNGWFGDSIYEATAGVLHITGLSSGTEYFVYARLVTDDGDLRSGLPGLAATFTTS